MAELPTGFGRPNANCSTCGDERGGPSGHGTSECQYFEGMSVFLLTKMPHMAGREQEIWGTYVDRYLDSIDHYLDANPGSESSA
jgi:hypothetical protein